MAHGSHPMAPPRAGVEIIQQSLWRDAIIIAVVWLETSQAWHKTACKGDLLHIYSCLWSFMAQTFPGVMLHIESHRCLLVRKRFDPTCLEFRSICWDLPIHALQIASQSTDNKLSWLICLHNSYGDVVLCLKCVKSPTLDICAGTGPSYFSSTRSTF